MNVKSFFGDALSQALDLGIGSPEDVLRYVTPDLLAEHLPRPLWARLLIACLGAPRVDAQLVVETIGVANLCEHLPGNVIWSVISDIAARALGQPAVTSGTIDRAAPQPIVAAKSAPQSVLAPPPPESIPASTASTPAAGPNLPPVNQPLADLITELENDERPLTPTRSRTPTSQRFRQSNTGIGRLGASAQQPRRPQAQAAVVPTPAPVLARPPIRRNPTEVEENETEVSRGSQREIPVDDSQLVDWSTETTHTTTDDDFSDIGRKR